MARGALLGVLLVVIAAAASVVAAGSRPPSPERVQFPCRPRGTAATVVLTVEGTKLLATPDTVSSGCVELEYDVEETIPLGSDRLPDLLLAYPKPTRANTCLEPGRYLIFGLIAGHRAGGIEVELTAVGPSRPRCAR